MVSTATQSRLMPQTDARRFRTSVAVIIQTKLASATKSGSFLIHEGWSHSLFQNGMIFSCDRKLDDPMLCVYMEHPDTDCTFFEVEVVNSREIADGQWEYSVVFRRLLKDVEFAM